MATNTQFSLKWQAHCIQFYENVAPKPKFEWPSFVCQFFIQAGRMFYGKKVASSACKSLQGAAEVLPVISHFGLSSCDLTKVIIFTASSRPPLSKIGTSRARCEEHNGSEEFGASALICARCQPLPHHYFAYSIWISTKWKRQITEYHKKMFSISPKGSGGTPGGSTFCEPSL